MINLIINLIIHHDSPLLTIINHYYNLIIVIINLTINLIINLIINIIITMINRY